MLKNNKQLHFSDIVLKNRKIKDDFLIRISSVIDWSEIKQLIQKSYSRGRRPDGRPAYPGILLFRISLIKEWYGLNYQQTELFVNDNIPALMFLELSLEESLPVSGTLMRFKKELKEKGIYQHLMDMVDNQIKQKGYTIIKGQFRFPQMMISS